MSQAIGKASMIPRKRGPHHQHRLDRRPGAATRAEMQMIAYNTSKGAVVNFTRALAGEWGKYGITVNAIAPGFFPSKMTKGTARSASGADKHGRRTRRCSASATTRT